MQQTVLGTEYRPQLFINALNRVRMLDFVETQTKLEHDLASDTAVKSNMCDKCLTNVKLTAKHEKMMQDSNMLSDDSSRRRYDQNLESTDFTNEEGESDASFDSEMLEL